MVEKSRPPLVVAERRVEPFNKDAWKGATCTAPLFGGTDPMMLYPSSPTDEQLAADSMFRSQYVDGGAIGVYEPGMAQPTRYAEGAPQIFNIQIAFVDKKIEGETQMGDPGCKVKVAGPVTFKASNVKTDRYRYEIMIPELYASTPKMVFYVDQGTYDLIAGMQKKGEPVVFGTPQTVVK